MGVAHHSPLTVGCDMTFWGWTDLYRESHPLENTPLYFQQPRDCCLGGTEGITCDSQSRAAPATEVILG